VAAEGKADAFLNIEAHSCASVAFAQWFAAVDELKDVD
jgi:hypothetical protein